MFEYGLNLALRHTNQDPEMTLERCLFISPLLSWQLKQERHFPLKNRRAEEGMKLLSSSETNWKERNVCRAFSIPVCVCAGTMLKGTRFTAFDSYSSP